MTPKYICAEASFTYSQYLIMATTIKHTFHNCDNNGQPIVLHQLIIFRGIVDNTQYGLEQKLREIFSKYGKICKYILSGLKIIKICYDNEESRDLAVQHENCKIVTSQSCESLSIGPYFSLLSNGKQLISSKLKYPNNDINQIQNCDNYWNKQLYPPYIVQHGLKNGIFEIRQTVGRFNIHCYHKDISHPFIIHMASENKIKQHIICIRPQSRYEIGIMLQKCDLELLKEVLPHTNSYGVDWRYFKLANLYLITHFALRSEYDKMEYMVNVIKCKPNHPKYELLHHAANKHDLKLVDKCLNKYEINPLLKNGIWGKTALEECYYAWNQYQRNFNTDDTNIIHFDMKQDGEEEADDEKKEDNLRPSSYNNIYIKSLLLENFLYVQNYGNVCFFNVIDEYKKFAQFKLEFIGENKYLIKVVQKTLSHKRIKSLKGDTDLKCDFILTAHINEDKAEFMPETEQITPNQCWYLKKEKKGNDEGYVFYVIIKGRKYKLSATMDCQLTLINDYSGGICDNNFEEGGDFNDIIKSWFVVLKNHQFAGVANNKHVYEWKQKTNHSLLKGDRQNCQRIHDIIVKRLEEAEKIEKLHGNTKGNTDNNKEVEGDGKNDDTNEIEKKRQKYKAKKVILDDNKQYGTCVRNNSRVYQGFCKKWNDMKGFGFITMDNGNGDVFVHKSEIRQGGKLYARQRVEFNVITQYDGRRKAINVIILDGFKQMNDNNYYGYNNSHRGNNLHGFSNRFRR